MLGKLLYWSIKILGYLLIIGFVLTTPEFNVLQHFGVKHEFTVLPSLIFVGWLLHFWFLKEIKEEYEIML